MPRGDVRLKEVPMVRLTPDFARDVAKAHKALAVLLAEVVHGDGDDVRGVESCGRGRGQHQGF